MRPLLILIVFLLSLGGVRAQAPTGSPTPDALKDLEKLVLGIDVEAKLKTLKNRDKITIKYDRFKDYTVVASKPFDLLTMGEHMAVAMVQGMGRGPYGRKPTNAFPSEFRLAAAFGFDGKRLTGDPKFGLIFISEGANWRFLKDHRLYALVDGERLDLGEGRHDGDVYLGGVTEEMIFSLTREQFEKFTNGKLVEIQLGGFERKLKQNNLDRLKTLLVLIS